MADAWLRKAPGMGGRGSVKGIPQHRSYIAGAAIALKEEAGKRLGLSIQDLEALALEYKIMAGETFEIEDNNSTCATLSYDPGVHHDTWVLEIEDSVEVKDYQFTSFGAALAAIIDNLTL
jgi:hypothetical protein